MDIDRELEKFNRKALERGWGPRETPKGCLFHFTSEKATVGILSSGVFRNSGAVQSPFSPFARPVLRDHAKGKEVTGPEFPVLRDHAKGKEVNPYSRPPIPVPRSDRPMLPSRPPGATPPGS